MTKDACCYTWVIPCPGGRPLVIDGAPRVADSVVGPAWASRAASVERGERFEWVPEAMREHLAVHYAREASFEHASVAAFARVSLSLLGAGAPPDLVADTHRAALDEIGHAEAMYALASTLRRSPVGPAALDLAGATSALVGLDEIAEEALLEGCAGEVSAALVLREEAARALDEDTRTTLARMAEDEERHAELAWRTVAWALRTAPESVLARLVGARASLEEELRTPDALDSRRDALPGVTSAFERRAMRRRALAEVVLPCLDSLLGLVSPEA